LNGINIYKPMFKYTWSILLSDGWKFS
jgi:hypothetical protein